MSATLTASISPSKEISREETLRRMPQLNRDGLLGSVEYSNGQFDDARYNLTLVHSFANVGGSALNHCRVTEFFRDSVGRLSGVVAIDEISGVTISVDARIS